MYAGMCQCKEKEAQRTNFEDFFKVAHFLFLLPPPEKNLFISPLTVCFKISA